MDVEAFLSSLLDALAECPFVESVDLDTEAIVVKGRVQLEHERFLQVYFNERTGTLFGGRTNEAEPIDQSTSVPL